MAPTITYGPASALAALLSAANDGLAQWPAAPHVHVALDPLIGTALMPNPTVIPSTLQLTGTPPINVPGATVGQILMSDASGNFTVQASAAIAGIAPSGDTTGLTDSSNIQAALTAGYVVNLTPNATYYVGTASSSATGINVPVPGGVLNGNLATVKYLGTGAAVYAHGSGPVASYPPNTTVIRDLVIDGTSAGAGSIGCDFGDGKNFLIWNVRSQNFTGTGCLGWHVYNATGYTEKATVFAYSDNNATAVVYDVAGGATSSFMYSSYEWWLNVNGGQNGIVVLKGNIQSQRRFIIYGNFFANASTLANAAVLDLSGNGSSNPRLSTSHVEIHVETDTASTSTWIPIRFGTNGAMFNCSGQLAFLDSGAWTPSDVSYGQFQFGGMITGNGTAINNLVKYNSAPQNWAPQAAPVNSKTLAATQTPSTNLALAGLGATYTPQSSGSVKADVTGFLLTPTAAVQAQLGARYGVVAQQFTATQASPAVFTAAVAGYTNGTQVTLTGSNLPGGFSAATTYFVVSASGSTFSLAATLGGAGINSSSAGSGAVQLAYASTPPGAQSFTATLASPCVFTPATTSFVNGTQVYLTGSSLPTGFSANTLYFVVNSTSTTFELATTLGGTPINSTGAGSGNVVQAATGTRFGSSSDPNVQPPATGSGVPFGFNDILALTPGTTYWFDCVNSSSNAADGVQLKNVSTSLLETS